MLLQIVLFVHWQIFVFGQSQIRCDTKKLKISSRIEKSIFLSLSLSPFSSRIRFAWLIAKWTGFVSSGIKLLIVLD